MTDDTYDSTLEALYPSTTPWYHDSPDPGLRDRSDLSVEEKAAWALYPSMRAPRTSEAAPIDPGLAKIYPSMKPIDVRMPVPVPSDSAAPGQVRPPEQSSPAAAFPTLPPEVQAALGEYAVQLPETWQPDTVELTSARDLFRSLGLDARQGGALLTHFVQLQERQAAADAARIEQWERQVAADAEVGGVAAAGDHRGGLWSHQAVRQRCSAAAPRPIRPGQPSGGCSFREQDGPRAPAGRA